MGVTAVLALAFVISVAIAVAYMLAQKPVTDVQQLIQQNRFAQAVAQPVTDSAGHLHRAEALKLLGRFEDAIEEYRLSDDPAAREGIALSLAHLGHDIDEAKRLMEQTFASNPAILEFQSLGLAWILLRRGDRESALRLYRDNLELLETRFRDDYTDRDPLLAETLFLFAEMARADGDSSRSDALYRKAAQWAPGSVFAKS